MRLKGVVVMGGRPKRVSYDPSRLPFRQRSREQQLELSEAQTHLLMERLTGVPVWVEHGRDAEFGNCPVGSVTRAFYDTRRNACVEFELDNSALGQRAAQRVRRHELRDLSMAHHAMSGVPKEVSLCRRGAREGTHITDLVQAAVQPPALATDEYKSAGGDDGYVVWASDGAVFDMSDPATAASFDQLGADAAASERVATSTSVPVEPTATPPAVVAAAPAPPAKAPPAAAAAATPVTEAPPAAATHGDEASSSSKNYLERLMRKEPLRESDYAAIMKALHARRAGVDAGGDEAAERVNKPAPPSTVAEKPIAMDTSSTESAPSVDYDKQIADLQAQLRHQKQQQQIFELTRQLEEQKASMAKMQAPAPAAAAAPAAPMQPPRPPTLEEQIYALQRQISAQRQSAAQQRSTAQFERPQAPQPGTVEASDPPPAHTGISMLPKTMYSLVYSRAPDDRSSAMMCDDGTESSIVAASLRFGWTEEPRVSERDRALTNAIVHELHTAWDAMANPTVAAAFDAQAQRYVEHHQRTLLSGR